jgi:serine protease AprX
MSRHLDVGAVRRHTPGVGSQPTTRTGGAAWRLVWNSPPSRSHGPFTTTLRAIAVAAVVLVSATAAALAGPAKPGKLDKALRDKATAQSTGEVRVIVRTTKGQRTVVKDRLTKAGRPVHSELGSIESLATTVTLNQLQALVDTPEVASVSLDAVVAPTAEPLAPPPPSGLPKNAPYSLRATLGLADKLALTGAGVGIAVIDSGILNKADFKGRIAYFRDFTNGSQVVKPDDKYGHGTHVAGLASGGDPKWRGLAPGARLIGLRVLDDSGGGYTSSVIAAIEFAIANQAVLGIDIINLSLGHPIYEPAESDPLVQAVEAAVRAGIVVVASAGNLGINPATGKPGYAGVTSPGNAPSAITVGAARAKGTTTRLDDEVAPYSSRGPTWYDAFAKPDVVAPGHSLTAVSDKTSYLFKNNPGLRYQKGKDNYLVLSGTSMAAGIVSGAVALIIEANRLAFPRSARLPPNAIKAILQATAIPVNDPQGGLYDVLTQGAGGINPEGAIRLAGALDPARPVGTPWLVKGIDASTTIDGVTHYWGMSVIWGDSIFWGDLLYTNIQAWARNIVWGDAARNNIVWGDAARSNIVWGDAARSNIVWGDAALWAYNVVWGNSYLTTVDGQNLLIGESVGERDVCWGELTVFDDFADPMSVLMEP